MFRGHNNMYGVIIGVQPSCLLLVLVISDQRIIKKRFASYLLRLSVVLLWLTTLIVSEI